MGSSVLDKIPFLRGCEDDDEDDSDEEEDFQGITTDCIDGRKNKKSRVKVRVFTVHADKESAQRSAFCFANNVDGLYECRWVENP